MAPLTLLTIDVLFVWKDPQQKAFEKVKEMIMSAPVLAHPRFEAPFILETDDFNFATGAVLLQVGEDGLEYPLSSTSSEMQLAENNYPIYGKEILNMMESLDGWRHYLL